LVIRARKLLIHTFFESITSTYYQGVFGAMRGDTEKTFFWC